MTRALLALAIVAAAAVAGDPPPLTAEQETELVRIIGAEAWGELPAWRQQVVRERFASFLAAPERKREAVVGGGLRDYLLQPRRTPEEQLPRPLAEAVERMPRRVRPLAEQFAFVRLRQLRLDRSLGRLPAGERRAVFDRLFPEPFDQEAAHAAYDDLRRREAKAFARELRERLKGRDPPPTGQERREIVREAIREEEGRILAEVREELAHLGGGDPERARRIADRFLAYRLENLRFVTPRQRELIRYALRPEECPLIDPDFIGPPPEDPRERRLWERDFRILARLDLLSEAGFGREMVLYLAGAHSPDDFLRGIQALRRPPRPAGR